MRQTSSRSRRRLAEAWELVLLRASRPAGPWQAPLARAAVTATAEDIRRLVGRLSDPDAAPAGVAMARDLLTDGTGPLYAVGPPRSLTGAVRHTLRLLDPAPESSPAAHG